MSGPTIELVDPFAPEVGSIWRRLEQAAQPAYFLSWAWVEHWLAALPRDAAPRLALVRRDDQPVAACFLGQRRTVRHGLIASRALFLNQTGRAELDQLCIEHNGILCGSEPGSLAQLVAALPGAWDELILPALSRATFPGSALGQALPHHRLRIERESPAPFVDLAEVRASPDGYAALLGRSTRSQLRRAQRGFGELAVEEATTERQAIDIYEELVELHQTHWRERHKPGAFANPFFDRFHRTLIAARIGCGEIQLLRIRKSDMTLGCLYNFVSHGRVLFYQSGFAHFDDPHLKAGYVAHAEAVRLNAAAGRSTYDLLAGDERYKHDLATGCSMLVWARVQKPLLRFAIEDQLRVWRQGVRSAVGALPAQRGAAPPH